jgi:hypothetical protein
MKATKETKEKKGVGDGESMVNFIKVHYIHMWKYRNETLCIINRNIH